MSLTTRRTFTRFTKTLNHFSKPVPLHRTFASVAMPYINEQNEFPQRSIAAVMMRSGTSKGLFLHRDHLPQNTDDWSPILLSAMGSATGDRRQLDGVGGATSTTSKVAVVSVSDREDADIDYTFAQVAVGSKKVDLTGNCGNMASGVGPFALDEGLVTAMPGQKEVIRRVYYGWSFSKDKSRYIGKSITKLNLQLDIRIFNTNTARILTSTVGTLSFRSKRSPICAVFRVIKHVTRAICSLDVSHSSNLSQK